MGILCGFRRGRGRRFGRGRFGGLDQLEVGGETIGGHVVLFVEQLVPFAALRDQTGDKALLYLHAVDGIGIGRVKVHGGFFDRDADVHRALHVDECYRLVGGFGGRLSGRLGRGRFGRDGRFAQAAQKRIAEGTLGIADIAPLAVFGHERHGSALCDRADGQIRVLLRLRVDGQTVDGHDHGFLGIERDKRRSGRLRLRGCGGLGGRLRLDVLLVQQIVLGIFVGQAGYVQNLRALNFVDIGLEGGNRVLGLLAVHAVGFTLCQPAALNQRVLQREDVRLRGVGRGAVLIFGLVAAEHVFHVLRLRVTGFAGVVDQHDPVLVFGDLAEAHVFAHAPLDDGVVAGALIDVGLIGDDLDQNRLVERGQKVGFVVRVDGGRGGRSLGGLRRLLRLGEALVAEQQLRVRVGQTVHRQKRRGGGHVHIVLEGHDRVVGRVVILAGGFSVQPAHGDELQLQFADANGGGVGADRAVVRPRGRAGAGIDGDRIVVQILEGGRAADAVHGQLGLVVFVHIGLERLHGGDGGGVIAARRLVGVQPAQLDQLPLQAADFRARGIFVHDAAVRHRSRRGGDGGHGVSPRIVDVVLNAGPRVIDGARGANRRLRGGHAFAGLLRHPVVVNGVDGLERVTRGIGRGGRRRLRVVGRLVGHQRQRRVAHGTVGRGGRAGADRDDHAHDDQHHGDAHHDQHRGQALEQAALLVVVASIVRRGRGGRFRGRSLELALDEIARAIHADKDVFAVCVLTVFCV